MPPKGERRKQQIIDTAKEMFIEKGFQSTHIGQVCEKLDIARGTVYQYFSNKKEILYALLDNVLEKVEDIFDQDDLKDFFDTSPQQGRVLDFINKRISSCITVLLGEPIVIKLIFKEIVGVDSEVNNKVNNSILSIEKVIAREIEGLMKMNIFKETLDTSLTSTMIIGSVMLIIYEYDKRNLDILEDKVINSIANNYLHGVLKE